MPNTANMDENLYPSSPPFSNTLGVSTRIIHLDSGTQSTQ